MDRADSAADTIVESSKALHDKQVEAGHILQCGAPFRALIAYYNGDPTKLRAVMTLCGFDEILEAVWPTCRARTMIFWYSTYLLYGPSIVYLCGAE